MKKYLLFIVASVAALALFAIITLSLGGHYGWLTFPSFWTIWLMVVLPVLLSTVLSVYFLNKFKTSETFTAVPMIVCSSVFAIISYVLGIILVSTMSATKTEVKWYMWTIEAIVLVIYAVIFFYFAYGTKHISTIRDTEKAKVNYLKEMVGELDAVIPFIKDEELKKSVTKLKDDIRFSDPMSKADVAAIEEELYADVMMLIQQINDGADNDACATLIQKARSLVIRRNAKVKLSK